MTLSFANFIHSLSIPEACKLDKPIYKKMFIDNGVLTASDKAALKDDVGKIRWLYTLKPSTINIAPYHDEEREYPEISILHIQLNSDKRVKRIANFINRSIPYPLILLFTVHQEDKDLMLVDLAPKRNSQADKDKWVIEDDIITDWIDLDLLTVNSILKAFTDSISIEQLPVTNFHSLYTAFCDRVTALNCSEITGQFRLEALVNSKSAENRLQTLKAIKKLSAEKHEIANRLRTEKNMGKQVELNTKIRAITEKIQSLSESL